MHIDDRLHRVAIGEFDIVEEAATQEGVGQFLLIVRRDDDDRAILGRDRLASLIHMERHAIEFLQQVVGKFDVGLVDLVDQQHGQGRGGECLPQLAFADIVGNVVDALVAQLAVAQTGDGVIFIQALMRLGRRFDVPFDQRRAQRGRNLLRQPGLAGARLPLHQQRAAQQHRGIDRDLQVVGGDIILGAFKTHHSSSACLSWLPD